MSVHPSEYDHPDVADSMRQELEKWVKYDA